MNCKRYAGTVEVTDVLTLQGVLADMPGVNGVIVSTVGFQRGAVDYASVHGIGLKIIRPPKDDDWTGRLRQISLDLTINPPELISCNVRLNSEWVKAKFGDDSDSIGGSGTYDAQRTVVRDLDTGLVNNMNELWNKALREHPTQPGCVGRALLQWKHALLERPGFSAVRVDDIEFQWRIRRGKPEKHLIRSEPMAIVRDAIAGTLLFIDPDGVITGDLEELGSR